jgi:hypothetical protein
MVYRLLPPPPLDVGAFPRVPCRELPGDDSASPGPPPPPPPPPPPSAPKPGKKTGPGRRCSQFLFNGRPCLSRGVFFGHGCASAVDALNRANALAIAMRTYGVRIWHLTSVKMATEIVHVRFQPAVQRIHGGPSGTCDFPKGRPAPNYSKHVEARSGCQHQYRNRSCHGGLASPCKSKSRLEAENVALRRQLIVLRRKVQAGSGSRTTIARSLSSWINGFRQS